MKYIGKSVPLPSKGVDFSHVERLTQSNEGVSLKDIIQRFIRGERLPVMHDAYYGVHGADLEKMKFADLVDRDQYVKDLKAVKKRYDEQEENNAKKLQTEKDEAAKKSESLRIKRAARKLAGEMTAKKA